MIRLEEGKYYRTRSGNKMFCTTAARDYRGDNYAALCIYSDIPASDAFSYYLNGSCSSSSQQPEDIVAEWKETRKVKLAPYLWKHSASGDIFMSEILFDSEEKAKRDSPPDAFVKWLIGTPYEVEVEIESST